MSRYRVGIDIGGTFTDFSVWDAEAGRGFGLKVPTVRHDPVAGLVAGIEALRHDEGVDPASIGYLVHGTTIAVNTLIERDGPKLALFVTAGFRDLLIIQRLHVPRPQYWYGTRPTPLIPRERVFEIGERLLADGTVRAPLDEADLRIALRAAREAGAEGIVICFLHSFRDPRHELAARAFIEREAPDLFACCSAEIWPRMREYERAVIAIMNAFVMPRVAGYLGKLEGALAELGMESPPYITRSDGGVMTARSARLSPAETLLSGPASGVIGAVQMAAEADIADLITLDIGGTSADVAFVEGGRPQISQSEHIAEFPMMMPVIGVSSIGAGGGSVIWLDEAGVLKIGPESVGSQPGPACYGIGDRPALTDAFLAGGFIDPAGFAGGRIALDRDRSERALRPIAKGLGTGIDGAVEGALRVTVASLYAELSNLAAQRGADPRDYTLVPFGGAGALLACRAAEELGMTRIMVPLTPGTLCAFGALCADVAGHFVHSLARPLAGSGPALQEAYRLLGEKARAWLAGEAPTLKDHRMVVAADMRYVGQSYEVDVHLEPRSVERGDLAAIAAAFHEMHRRVYAHADPGLPVELVDLRLLIAGTTPKPAVTTTLPKRPGKPKGSRDAVIAGSRVTVPTWRRGDLASGQVLAGPALVDQPDTTIFVAESWTGTVHASGNLLLARGAAR